MNPSLIYPLIKRNINFNRNFKKGLKGKVKMKNEAKQRKMSELKLVSLEWIYRKTLFNKNNKFNYKYINE